jgi:tetratricopeptide (TPR) repeat protein
MEIPRINNRLAILLILVLTVIVYANSLKNEFVWDDYTVIVDNSFVKSWRNLPSLFKKAYLTRISDFGYWGERYIGSGETTYRPVVTVSYFTDYAIWKLNPLGYHISNLAIHILNALLLFALLNIITGNGSIALIASLFFALHPANTEAVNVISFREDLLACLFFLLSFLMYVSYQRNKGAKKTLSYFVSVASFLFALFSKESAIMFPFILILYDYFFVSQQKIKEVLCNFKSYYAGYVLAAFFYLGGWLFLMQGMDKPLITPAMSNFYTRILTMPRVIFTYIRWMLFPINIHPTLPDDPLLITHSLFKPGVLISIVVMLALFIIAIKIRRTFALISFGIFWFFITLIPVSNILLPLTNYMAARYLYIPIIGFCLSLATCLVQLPNIDFPAIRPAILRKLSGNTILIILLSYSSFTVIQNLGWKNDIVLWLRMVEMYPDNTLAHNSLGEAFRKRGFLDRAIREYKITLRLDPDYAKTHDDLGVCYYKKGKLDDAIKEFKKTIELEPSFAAAYANLGSALGDKGFYQEAIGCFKEAIKLDPKFINAYDGLGVTYTRMKSYDYAREIWERALKIEPDNRKVQENLKKLKRLLIN